MNITVVLEVAIGVMFVWILLAVITSAVQEWISQLFKWKADMLAEAIGNILADGKLADEFYSHPLIKSLHSKGGKRKPSQIPSKQFASVVFDLLIKAGTGDSPANKAKPVFKKLRESIDTLKKVEEVAQEMGKASGKEGKKGNPKNLAKVLDTLLIDVSAGVEKTDEAIGEARARVESWFNDAMERVGGAYKRRTQLWALIIGIVLAALLNADSLSIANHLWRDPLVREALVAQAQNFQLPENQQGQNPEQTATQYFNELQGLSVPLGWTPENMPAKFDAEGRVNKDYGSNWVLKIGGILLSGIVLDKVQLTGLNGRGSYLAVVKILQHRPNN